MVRPEDDIYILGDLIYRAEDPVSILKQLTGRLHLIKGNHDKFIKTPSAENFSSRSMICLRSTTRGVG